MEGKVHVGGADHACQPANKQCPQERFSAEQRHANDQKGGCPYTQSGFQLHSVLTLSPHSALSTTLELKQKIQVTPYERKCTAGQHHDDTDM
jgi:hypothetical protein